MSDSVVISTTGNQVFAGFAFIGFVLVLIPLPWHLQSWNTGTCLYMLWASLGCFNYFVNAIIWNNNAINVAPRWCDLSAAIIIAGNIGIPAASLCINRRLYQISALRSARITDVEKRRGIYEDLAIGLLLPLLGVPFAYITQSNRFVIFEQVGCMPGVANTVLAFIFIWIPPLIIGLVSGVYCSLTIHSFNQRRSMFKDRLSANNVNANRYFRLMALASVDLAFTVPIASYFIYDSARSGVVPWISWHNIHQDYSQVILIPALLWQGDPHTNFNTQFSRALSILCAFVFFGFFGFAEEARKNYWSVYTSVSKRVGLSTGSVGTVGATSTAVSHNHMTSSFGKGLISFGGKSTTTPVIVCQETTRTTDGDDLSTYKEKNPSSRVSASSLFEEIKVREFQPSPA